MDNRKFKGFLFFFPLTLWLSALVKLPDANAQPQPSLILQGPGQTATDKTQTVLSYLLTLPCEGWQTSLINLSGHAPPQTNLVQDNLYGLIEQDLLKEYGCQVRAKRILHRGQRKIIIEAYQFATTAGAYGAYCAAHKGSSSYQLLGDASSEDQDSLSFYQDKYFICLYSTEPNDEEAKTTISQLALQISNKIKVSLNNNSQNIVAGSQRPGIFAAMPSMERLRGSEKLAMGPISLKRFFVAPFSANLAPLTEGTIADYKLEEPDRDRLKLLIAYYPSAKDAALIYANYVGMVSSQHKEKSIDGFTYQTALFKLSNSFLLCQLRDKQIIVISGARHKDSVSQLAREIF